MVKLSQRNPLWATHKIGQTSITIGRFGCTITGLSMLSDYYGSFHNPAELADQLKFTVEGLVIWSSLPAVLPFHLEHRLYHDDRTAIEEAIQDPKRSALLQVDGYHWVVATGLVSKTKHYNIVDPWDGKKKTTSSYGHVTGCAIFIRN